MFYDKDVWNFKVENGKTLIEYLAPTEQAIFTREDLVFLLKLLDDNELCKHKDLDSYVLRDVGLQVTWVYSSCSDCGYLERVPVMRDLSVGDKEILSGEQ